MRPSTAGSSGVGREAHTPRPCPGHARLRPLAAVCLGIVSLAVALPRLDAGDDEAKKRTWSVAWGYRPQAPRGDRLTVEAVDCAPGLLVGMASGGGAGDAASLFAVETAGGTERWHTAEFKRREVLVEGRRDSPVPAVVSGGVILRLGHRAATNAAGALSESVILTSLDTGTEVSHTDMRLSAVLPCLDGFILETSDGPATTYLARLNSVGSLKWTFSIPPSEEKNPGALSGWGVVGESVFALFGRRGVLGLFRGDAGQGRFAAVPHARPKKADESRRLDLGRPPAWTGGGEPAIGLFGGAGGAMEAVSLVSGRVLWTAQIDAVWGQDGPILAGARQHADKPSLVGIDTQKQGKEIWSVPIQCPETPTLHKTAHSWIFADVGGTPPGTPRLVRIKSQDGTIEKQALLPQASGAPRIRLVTSQYVILQESGPWEFSVRDARTLEPAGPVLNVNALLTRQGHPPLVDTGRAPSLHAAKDGFILVGAGPWALRLRLK